MADLNKLMNNVLKQSAHLKKDLKKLLTDYEILHREAHHEFSGERLMTGSMEGLEDFYTLVNIIRRNRDIIGSLTRGINSLRPMDKFQFVETSMEPAAKEQEVQRERLAEISIPETVSFESAAEQTMEVSKEDLNG